MGVETRRGFTNEQTFPARVRLSDFGPILILRAMWHDGGMLCIAADFEDNMRTEARSLPGQLEWISNGLRVATRWTEQTSIREDRMNKKEKK